MNCFDVSPAALWAMEQYRVSIEAEEMLRSGKVADRDVYDVALLAYGDERIASKMLAARIRARQERGERTAIYR